MIRANQGDDEAAEGAEENAERILFNAAEQEDASEAASEEEEEEDSFRAQEDLVKILSQFDPDRMKLTKEEHDRAVLIKNMVEMMPDLENLSDFMYAQLAIVVKDDIDGAIYRCYGMQDFRQEYKILDTYEHGSQMLKKTFRVFPDQLLSFTFSEKDGCYVFAHDMTKFEPKKFTQPDMVDEWLASMYYSHTLFSPDLESVRKGIICVVECEGMSMRRDIIKHFHMFFTQCLQHYPFIGMCLYYHTGAIMNIFASMLKPILSSDLRKRCQVGLQFDGHLGDAFLVPTMEEANKRMLANMEDALRLRYNNEETFSLEENE